MLVKGLKEFGLHQIVHRKPDATVPLTVEYSLTEKREVADACHKTGSGLGTGKYVEK